MRATFSRVSPKAIVIINVLDRTSHRLCLHNAVHGPRTERVTECFSWKFNFLQPIRPVGILSLINTAICWSSLTETGRYKTEAMLLCRHWRAFTSCYKVPVYMSPQDPTQDSCFSVYVRITQRCCHGDEVNELRMCGYCLFFVLCWGEASAFRKSCWSYESPWCCKERS
jgi:hypothetical protein